MLALLGIVILIFTGSVLRFWNKMAETSRNKEIVADKVLALKEQQETLLADLEELATDRGKEEFVRENFGLAKEGEEVIIIVADKSPTPEPRPGALRGFLSFFENWFK